MSCIQSPGGDFLFSATLYYFVPPLPAHIWNHARKLNAAGTYIVK